MHRFLCGFLLILGWYRSFGNNLALYWRYCILLICLLAFLAVAELRAVDSSSVVVITRLAGTIEFDGIPDEAAWQAISPFQMVTHSPVFGQEPTEKTDIRVTYDDEYIYIGACFYAEDASLIQSSTKKRDDLGGDSDWLGVLFDTYNDNENAVIFWTNPSGIRSDMSVFNDGVSLSPGEPPMNSSWNTFWDVETRTTDQGWFIEMRIPTSSLRFQVENDEVIMGMTLMRWIPYLNETYVYPDIPNVYGDWSTMKVSRAQKVVFRDLKSRNPLYVSFYGIGGITQLNELNDAETQYDYRREEKLNAGLDIKYGISSNLTLDATLNTDFAQVESDDEKVNLTRFSLFFEEKRQFFLERASLFDFNSGGTSTMFYSRRIGLDEDSNPVPIIGGVRLIGRKGPWDAGFINMQTAKSDSLASENFGIIRLKRKVINTNSYMGVILTSRMGMDGSYNEAYGLDALIRVRGDEYIKMTWGQTFESGMKNLPSILDNSRYQMEWERRRQAGFYYKLSLSGSGEEYNPGIGFLDRSDYHRYGMKFFYTWMKGEDSPILKHGPGFNSASYISQSRGAYESMEYTLSYEFQMKSFWFTMVKLTHNYENVFELFELSDDVNVPIGDFWFPCVQYMVMTPMTRSAWAMMELAGGGYYDGRYLSMTLMPNWSLSSSFNLSGAYIFNRVDFSHRNQVYLCHIGRVKALYMFNTKISASAFIQYNSEADNVSTNFRFRYNPREGNDLYLVYNEGTNTDLNRDMMSIPRMADRTIMLKYTYTFRF